MYFVLSQGRLPENDDILVLDCPNYIEVVASTQSLHLLATSTIFAGHQIQFQIHQCIVAFQRLWLEDAQPHNQDVVQSRSIPESDQTLKFQVINILNISG
jgi:hypothetical protein